MTFRFPTPGVMRYFGYPDSLAYKQSATAVAMEPASFVRTVDLAWDAVTVISEKLGVRGQLDKIINGINEVVKFVV